MNVYEAIMQRRTIRKFTPEAVSREQLLKLADCGRMAAFGANMQPLRFALITDKDIVEKLYPMTKWAGYLPDGAPAEDERPTAYIAILGDTDIRKNGAFETDAGAAVTNMMLAACEDGLATCWLGAIDRDGIHSLLGLGDNLKVTYLLAVGYAAQESKAVDMKDGDVKYYVGEDGGICVPKRALADIVDEY